METAAQRWARAMADLAIPEHILRAAPESPYGFPPELWAQGLDQDRATPSRLRALEALPSEGTVIDVGCGGGAASLPLVPPAGGIVAVDQSAVMLERFLEAATERDVAHRTVEGSWPEVASEVEAADVVVAHHVLYNVPHLHGFISALTDHARRRVVVELTAVHPMVLQNHLWRHFHGIERPNGPTAKDAIDVLEEMGLEVGVETWERPHRWRHANRASVVAFTRRRLCLSADRDSEIDALLGPAEHWGMQSLVTLWWRGSATAV